MGEPEDESLLGDTDYLLARLEAAEAALEASVGLYRGEVGAEEMQAAMDAWQQLVKEAQRG